MGETETETQRESQGQMATQRIGAGERSVENRDRVKEEKERKQDRKSQRDGEDRVRTRVRAVRGAPSRTGLHPPVTAVLMAQGQPPRSGTRHTSERREGARTWQAGRRREASEDTGWGERSLRFFWLNQNYDCLPQFRERARSPRAGLVLFLCFMGAGMLRVLSKHTLSSSITGRSWKGAIKQSSSRSWKNKSTS